MPRGEKGYCRDAEGGEVGVPDGKVRYPGRCFKSSLVLQYPGEQYVAVDSPCIILFHPLHASWGSLRPSSGGRSLLLVPSQGAKAAGPDSRESDRFPNVALFLPCFRSVRVAGESCDPECTLTDVIVC